MYGIRTRDWLLGGLIIGSVAVTFVSWGASGSVGRNSYELVDSSRALGLLDAGAARFAPAWFALPFVAAATVVALALGWRRLAGALAIGVGASMIAAAIVVKSSPVGVDTGAVAGALLGAATLVVGAALFIPEGTNRREPERPHPPDRSEPAGAARAGGADHRSGDACAAPSAATTTTPSSTAATTAGRSAPTRDGV